MSLNLASDLSSPGNSGEKGDLGIERAKERDKVERYLKDRCGRQKDGGEWWEGALSVRSCPSPVTF